MALTRPKYSQIYDTDWKQPVRVATTGDVGNLVVGNTQPNTVDGVSLSSLDRILVKDQGNSQQNGLYYVLSVGTGSNGWWIRSQDADTNGNGKVTSGMTTTVSEGSVNISKTYKLSTPNPITLGVTPLTFLNPFVAGSAPGANTQVQFNDGGVSGASSGFTFNKTNSAAYISGNVTVGGTGLFTGPYNESSTTPGVFIGNTGSGTPSPRIGFFTGNAALNWQVDNYGGSFRWFTPGTTRMTLDVNGNLSIPSTTTSTSTSTGALQVGGGLGVAGNVYATTHYGNIGGGSTLSDVYITGNLIPTANVTYNLGSPTNKFKSAYFSGNTVYIGSESISVDGSGTWAFSSAGSTVSMGANASFNPPSANISGNLTAANVTANHYGTIMTASQPNITTVGNLTSLSLSGTLQTTGIIYGNSGISGTLLTASQTNITSLGNLTSLSLSGTLQTTGIIYGNSGISGTLLTASQTNITSLGNLTSLSIAGTSTHYGSATFNGGITGTLQTASQPNITTLAGVTSIGASSSTTLTGILQTAAQTNITSVGSLTTLNVLGNTTIGGNLTVTGSITTIGNVNNITITGNAGQFFGNVNGFGALYAGIGTGYFIEPQTTFQISSNYNGYAMLNMQNVNSGPLASSDLILTPNNGSANDTFFDIGVASSTYNYPGYSLIKPNDGYLIAYGNATIGGGNLILSTGLANDIIFAVNGTNTASEFGRVQASSNALLIKSTTAASNTTSGALQVAGGLGVAGNLYAGNVSATYIVGNGSLLTGLPAGYANTNVAAYLPGYTGASGITSVGTLTGLTVSGLVNHSLTTANTATAIFTHGSDGNFQLTAQNGVGYNTTGSEVARFGINYNTAGWDSFTQYVRGASSQNGYQSLWASNTPIANVTSSGVSVTGTVSATTFSGAGTSLTGTASSLTAGAVTNGFYTTSSFNLGTTSIAVNRSSATQSLTGINIDGSAGSVPASGLTGSTLASGVTASSLTSVGTLTGLTTSGTITTKTPVVATALSSANYGAIEIPDPSPANSGTNYIIGYHQTSTLSGYGYRQHLSIGQKRVASNQWGAAVIAVGGNDGYPTVEWLYNYDGTSNFPGQINGTVFAGKATSAQYADLAEIYSSDKKYVPGTVVVFGGDKEITISTQSHDPSIAGVVSTDPAYLMNSEADGLPIALQGRVPCRVQGPVKKGDRLVSSDMPGIATVMDKTLYEPGCIIGKALEDITDDRVHTIEVVVGRV